MLMIAYIRVIAVHEEPDSYNGMKLPRKCHNYDARTSGITERSDKTQNNYKYNTNKYKKACHVSLLENLTPIFQTNTISKSG